MGKIETSRACVVFFIALAAAAAFRAQGQIVIDRIRYTATASSSSPEPNSSQIDSRVLEPGEYSGRGAVNSSSGGSSGSASASINITPNASGFTGSISGSASGSVALANATSHQGGGTGFIEFTIEEGGATLTATGALSASGAEGSYGARFHVFDSKGDVLNIQALSPPAPEAGLLENATVNANQVLNAGTYTLVVGANALPFLGGGGSAMAEASFSLTASGPAPAQIYFWEANDGSYTDSGEWEPTGVRGPGDIAIFDRDAVYTVSIGTQETGRAIVDRQKVDRLLRLPWLRWWRCC